MSWNEQVDFAVPDAEPSRYLKDTTLTFAAQLGALVLAFLFNVVLARFLGPTGKGVVAITSLFPFLMAMIMALGIDEANVYLLGGKRFQYKRVFSNSIYLSLVLTGLGLGLLFRFKNQLLSHLLKNLDERYFLLSVLSVPFFLFLRYGRTILQGQKDFLRYNLVNLVRYGLNLVLCVILVMGLRMGVLGGVLTIPLTVALTTCIASFYLVRYDRPSPLPYLPLLKRSLSYGVRAQPGVLLNFFNKRLDMFIINFFLTSAAVGYYSISVVLAELLWHLPNAFGTTLFPKVAGATEARAHELTSFLSRNLLLIMIGTALVLGVLAKSLVLLLFGSSFLPALIPLWILLPGVIALGIMRILCTCFQGRGKPEYGTYLTIVSVSFTVALDLVLIPKFGIIGAAIASTAAYSVAGTLSVFLFRAKSKLPFNAFLLARAEDIRGYPALVRTIIRKIRA